MPSENIRGQVLTMLERLSCTERIQVAAEIMNTVGMDRAACRILMASLDADAQEGLRDCVPPRIVYDLD